jgi:hypothetical protein
VKGSLHAPCSQTELSLGSLEMQVASWAPYSHLFTADEEFSVRQMGALTPVLKGGQAGSPLLSQPCKPLGIC